MKAIPGFIALCLLAGCATAPTSPQAPSGSGSSVTVPAPQPTTLAKGSGSDSFTTVVRRVEPVAEAYCAQRLGAAKCDYQIVLDNRPGQPANAFQTLDRNGRPVLIVTSGLLKELQNAHEAAFVLGHEAAHHIEGHIPRTQSNSVIGAVAAGELARVMGANGAAIAQAQEFGAFAGARQFSKNYELEADSLGTVIAYSAGYDPLIGVEYFTRIPDPGDMFLGTHPPNADRVRVVRQVAAQIY
jgi:predicted Zn-dependent protease